MYANSIILYGEVVYCDRKLLQTLLGPQDFLQMVLKINVLLVSLHEVKAKWVFKRSLKSTTSTFKYRLLEKCLC